MFRKTPAYLLHTTSGQARIRIDGREIYLGKYDSPESRERYDEIIAAWLRRQKVAPVTLTIAELALLFLAHARTYYVKGGKPTSEVHDIRAALRPLIAEHGRERVRDFGPLKLKSVRDSMVEKGWSRSSVNSHIGRIRRMFRWGVAEEHVSAELLVALEALAGLKKGKTKAKELPRIKPVDDATIDATLPYLPPIVADMVRIQRVTGMRPQEVCGLRPAEIDCSGDVWVYRPSSHKTEHHGQDRIIYIGPIGQDILRPYMLRERAEFCFSPIEAEQARRAAATAARKVPADRGNRPGTNRQRAPRRQPGTCYSTVSYRRAITRACNLAFPVPSGADAKEWRKSRNWAPNRVRHSFATLVRKQFDLEHAQVILGHAHADMSEHYAEQDAEKGRAVAAAVG